jgi:hypothetical protein
LTITPTEHVARIARPGWVAALTALPPLLLGAVVLVMLVLATAGRHPMWQVPDFNLSEAAGSRDAATVALLISRGDDPNRGYPVRRGVISARGYDAMTPMDAAFAARRLEIMHLLLRRGGVVDEARRVAYVCRSRTLGDDDIVRYFEARGGPVSCGPGGGSR